MVQIPTVLGFCGSARRMILGYSNPSSKTLCVYGRLRVFKRGLTRITFDPSIFPFPKASRRDIPPRVCTFARRPQFARNFSSRKANSGSDAFQNTFGLSFSISPDRALQKFEAWARTEQGLNSFLMKGKSVRITAAYCPVWSFDVNVRYIITDPATGRKRFDWKPDLFSVYGTQSVIHVPGLAAYAGHTYRRSLIDPLHNTALVFIGEKIVPFGAWMLRDMKLSTGERLQVYPDPWNTTRGRAFAIVKEALESLPGASGSEIRVQTEVVSSRRVYMPTYAFNYKVLGMEYQAFVSGCDDGAAVAGVSHKVFDFKQTDLNQATTFLSSAASTAHQGLRVLGGRQLGTLIVVALQFFGSLGARILARVPLIAALGGAFVGFRKIIRPWMDNRSASAEWERQREHEATMQDKFEHIDDFVDSGTARRYFQANRGRILHHFGGSNEHRAGAFDWYSEWEKWARQQWEQQQRQQGSYTSQQQRQRQDIRQRSNQEFQWDFDPQDPYSVLGVNRGASISEVSAAFRKQMMMYHPDTKNNSSEAEKARAIERSKLITSAYQTIKSQAKK